MSQAKRICELHPHRTYCTTLPLLAFSSPPARRAVYLPAPDRGGACWGGTRTWSWGGRAWACWRPSRPSRPRRRTRPGASRRRRRRAEGAGARRTDKEEEKFTASFCSRFLNGEMDSSNYCGAQVLVPPASMKALRPRGRGRGAGLPRRRPPGRGKTDGRSTGRKKGDSNIVQKCKKEIERENRNSPGLAAPYRDELRSCSCEVVSTLCDRRRAAGGKARAFYTKMVSSLAPSLSFFPLLFSRFSCSLWVP